MKTLTNYAHFPASRWCSQVLLVINLTLIGPGKVKVDLADLQENLLNTSFFLDLFLQKCLSDLFEVLT
jgi:hypothetical protein